MKSNNYSVKEILRIADKYGYRISAQVVHSVFGDKVFLYANHPFLKSPYPRLLSSYAISMKTLEKLEEEEIL